MLLFPFLEPALKGVRAAALFSGVFGVVCLGALAAIRLIVGFSRDRLLLFSGVHFAAWAVAFQLAIAEPRTVFVVAYGMLAVLVAVIPRRPID